MEDSSTVETEHVEKITRTSSVPQISLEGSIDRLDETELYDIDSPYQSTITSVHESHVSNGIEIPVSIHNGVNQSKVATVTADMNDDLANKPEKDQEARSGDVVDLNQANAVEDALGDERQVADNDSSTMGNAIASESTLDDNANALRSSPSSNDGSFLGEPVATEPDLNTGVVEDLEAVRGQTDFTCDDVHDCRDTRVPSKEDNCQLFSNGAVDRLNPQKKSEMLLNDDAQSVNCNDARFSLQVLSNGSGDGDNYSSPTKDTELESVQKSVMNSFDGLPTSLTLTADELKPAANSSVIDDTAMQTLEKLCNSVKEPDEGNHAEHCCLENEQLTKDSIADDSIEENWSRGGLLGNDKLKKLVIKRGELGNRRPQDGQLVTIRCSGQLADGTAVDQHDRLSLILGDEDFIEAFDICIKHMRVGEVCQLDTDAQYAYGKWGREPDIPKNASVTYEIELKDVENLPEFFKLPISVRIQLSNLKRERGNVFYSRNESARAIEVYRKALKIVDDSSESHVEDFNELQMLLDARVKCHNNLAAALLKVEHWDSALQSINHVLHVQPENVKALFRKGKCLMSKGAHEAAIPYLQKAARLEPETKIIQQELARLEKWSSEQKESQKAMYKKMLGGEKKRVKGKKENSSSSSSHSSSSTWWWFGVAATTAALAVTIAMYRRFGHS